VKLSGGKIEIYIIGNIRNQNRCTLFKKPDGIRSRSHCLMGLEKRILDISDSDAGMKTEKTGMMTDMRLNVEIQQNFRRNTGAYSLDILSTSNEAK